MVTPRIEEGIEVTRVKAEDRALKVLIQEIQEGKLALPPFQRDFVWDTSKVKDLIDSLVKQYPIGVIILWKPSTKNIGKVIYPIPLSDNYANSLKESNEVFYILDGQQRLTSLMLVLEGYRIIREGRLIQIEPISYDLNKGEFVIGSGRGIDLHKVFKAFFRYDVDAMNDLRSEVPKGMWDHIRNLFMKISEYRIPVYIMETDIGEKDSIPKIAKNLSEAFIRINKAGIRVGNFELIASLAATSLDPRISSKLREIYNEVKDYNIGWSPILRLFCREVNVKQTDIVRIPLRALEGLRRKMEKRSAKEVLNGLDKLRLAFLLFLRYLESSLGKYSLELLPSQIAIIPIIYYLRLKLESTKITDVKDLSKDDLIL